MLRRGEFAYITKGWRNLSPGEIDSWVDAAGSMPAAVRLFTASNVNLSLLDLPLITEFLPSREPDPMPLQIDSLSASNLAISASSVLSEVPAGTALLISATAELPPARAFINPSQFSPIINFAAGFSIAPPTDIADEWSARYGVLLGTRQLCIQSSLINITNGLRSAFSSTCAIGPFILQKMKTMEFNGVVGADPDLLRTTGIALASTLTRDATGQYLLEVTAPVSGTEYIATANPIGTPSGRGVSQVTRISATQWTIFAWGPSGALTDDWTGMVVNIYSS
jgi:hypothetical protein